MARSPGKLFWYAFRVISVVWAVFVLARLGVGNGVVISAATVNTAAEGPGTPTLDDLIACPASSDGIFSVVNTFSVIYCADGNDTLTQLSVCSNAIQHVVKVLGPTDDGDLVPLLPPIPILPVDLARSTGSRALIASYVARLPLDLVGGLAFRALTVDSGQGALATATENQLELEALIVGVRGLVSLSYADYLPVLLFFADPFPPPDEENACGSGGGLHNGTHTVDVPGLFLPLLDTVPFLLFGQDLKESSASCNFDADHLFRLGPELPATFPSSEMATPCSASAFADGSGGSAPSGYYRAVFEPVGEAVPRFDSALTGLSAQDQLFFVPSFDASTVLDGSTDLVSAIECVVSGTTELAHFGQVVAALVDCGEFFSGPSQNAKVRVCSDALTAVHSHLPDDIQLFILLQVSLLFTDPLGEPPTWQAVHVAEAVYGGGPVSGLVFELGAGAHATATTAEQAINQQAFLQFLSALEAYYTRSLPDYTFPIFIWVDTLVCSPGAPFGPVGSGRTRTLGRTCQGLESLACLLIVQNAGQAQETDPCGFTDVLSSPSPFGSIATHGWVALQDVATTETAHSDPSIQCDEETVRAAYVPLTLSFTGTYPPQVPDVPFGHGAVGGYITPIGALGVTQTSLHSGIGPPLGSHDPELQAGPAAICLFESGGIQADHAIIACQLDSEEGRLACTNAFGAVRKVNASAVLIVGLKLQVSESLASEGAAMVSFMALVEAAGMFLSFGFGGGASAGTGGLSSSEQNIDAILSYVGSFLSNAFVERDTAVSIGIDIGSPERCLPPPDGSAVSDGSLFVEDLRRSLYNRLVDLGYSSPSFVLLADSPSPNPSLTRLCGFPFNRIGYRVVISRSLTGPGCDALDENITYSTVVLPHSTAPSNSSRTGGDDGGGSDDDGDRGSDNNDGGTGDDSEDDDRSFFDRAFDAAPDVPGSLGIMSIIVAAVLGWVL